MIENNLNVREKPSEKSLRKFSMIGIAGAISFVLAHLYVSATWDGSYEPWFLNSQQATAVTEMWMLFTSTVVVAVSGPRSVISAIFFFGGVLVGVLSCLLWTFGTGNLSPTIPAFSMIILTPAIGFGALIGHGMKMLIKMNDRH